VTGSFEIVTGIHPAERVLIGGQENYAENEHINPLLTEVPASETMQRSGGMIDLNAENNTPPQKKGGAH
jgi:hypothetical protein